MAISQGGVFRSTLCLVLWWGFRGRQIKWRYFRFRQIQAAILENSNGNISAADHAIYSVFGSRMRFSGSADPNGAISSLSNLIGVLENNARGVIRLNE